MTRLPCHVIKAAVRAEKPHKAALAGPALRQRDPWLVESLPVRFTAKSSSYTVFMKRSRSALCKNRILLLFIDLVLDPGTDLTVTSNLYSWTGTTHISGGLLPKLSFLRWFLIYPGAASCHHRSHDSGLLCLFILTTTFVFHLRENTWATRWWLHVSSGKRELGT